MEDCTSVGATELAPSCAHCKLEEVQGGDTSSTHGLQDLLLCKECFKDDCKPEQCTTR
jgi:hypothetical protein